MSTIPPVVKNNSHHGISTIKSDYPEICALLFAYDDPEQDEESDDEPAADTAPVELKPTFDPEALKKIAGTSMTVEDNGDIRLSFKHQ